MQRVAQEIWLYGRSDKLRNKWPMDQAGKIMQKIERFGTVAWG